MSEQYEKEKKKKIKKKKKDARSKNLLRERAGGVKEETGCEQRTHDDII
jgi:hypothetical protein